MYNIEPRYILYGYTIKHPFAKKNWVHPRGPRWWSPIKRDGIECDTMGLHHTDTAENGREGGGEAFFAHSRLTWLQIRFTHAAPDLQP